MQVKYLSLILIISLIFIGSECSTSDDPVDSPCGSKATPRIDSKGMEGNLSFNVPVGSPGSEARVSWKIAAENVCTHQHPLLNITLELNKNFYENRFIRVESDVLLRGLLPFPLTMSVNWDTGNATFRANEDFGLKSAYGDGPGEFTYFLELYFKSTGNQDEDYTLAQNGIALVQIFCEYYNSK